MTIEHKNLNQLVYERLRTEILEGKLGPETRLKQEELTERLGVSRTPVREAIQRLETEGLVQYVQRKSAIVSAISKRKIEEIFELRALLEGYAAVKATENLSEKDLQQLRKMISQMDNYHSNQEVERLLKKNDQFHRFICSKAENETLLEMLGQIWRDIKRLRINYLYTPEGHEKSTREHEQLVGALESHDKKRIRKIVDEHSQSSKEGILKTLEVSSNES